MTAIRDQLLYKPEYFIAEYELASYIRDIHKAGCQKIEPLLDGLKHRQPEAVLNACTKPISILTGPAGTGKTTTLKNVIQSFTAAGMRGVVACPSGKAAKRAHYSINGETKLVDCSTIHSLLQYDPYSGGFVFNRYNKFSDIDYLVVDEYPMTDLMIARDLLSAIEPGSTRVIFSGDPNQLPSVDPGSIGRDLLMVPQLPAVVLDTVLRQGPKSGIVVNANRVLNGQPFIKKDPVTGEDFTDCFFTVRPNEQETFQTILNWMNPDNKNGIPQKRGWDAVDNIQCLSPGKRSHCGTEQMNQALQKIFSTSKRTMFGFTLGDKVINNDNNKQLGIVNGDVGVIRDMLVAGSSSDHRLVVDFGYAQPTKMTQEQSRSLSLAYCFTVHKSQGSEYKAVLGPIHTSHSMLLTRNLLYTWMTRASELFCLVGDPKAFEMAIRNDSPSRRKSRLRVILLDMLK